MSSSSEQQKTNDGDHNNTNGFLKKGKWSKNEDEILVDYVKEYGTKNWNAIQKKAVLNRCGKSCRLRWYNHLKPGVKKGPFSEHEVEEVIRMQKLGFTWCQMAQQLPGRSDNDIKNFCNLRKRKENKNLKLSGSSSLSDDHELNDNRVNGLSGSSSMQVDDSQEDKFNIPKVKFQKHNFHRKYPSNYDEMNENNYSEQLPKLVDDSNKQLPKFSKLVDDSKMLYNNVGSTSISNHTTTSWINRVPNPSPFPPYFDFQNMDYPLPSIEHNLHRRYHVPNKELPKRVDDLNMLYKYVGSASTSNHTTPTWTNRAGIGTFMHLARVPNQNMDYTLPSLEHSLYGKYPSISDEINKNNFEELSNSFQVPNKELQKLVDDLNMFYNNVGSISTSNHTTPTCINRGGNGTSCLQSTMVPPCVVCKGSGRVDCHCCQGRGRTNMIHLKMLPKGEWPKWCRACGGSGNAYCSGCL